MNGHHESTGRLPVLAGRQRLVRRRPVHIFIGGREPAVRLKDPYAVLDLELFFYF